MALTGADPSNAHAHHVFPVKFKEDFAALGIDISESRFGAWWEASDHLSNAYDYNQAWRRFLDATPTRDEVINYGRELATRYGFEISF